VDRAQPYKKVTFVIFFIRFKVWVVIITKYEKKQAILVDFRMFAQEGDYNFFYQYYSSTE
jgi:hypothetical protein